ncbi:MAG: hypothetical protein HQ581_27855 [Planctomycetes bacterium]|nr:hypothetical protein [Planctomycetota bacterium]
MNLSETISKLLGRLLGLKGTESVTDFDVSLAAPWAAEGPAWLLFGCAALIFTAIVFYIRFQNHAHAGARCVLALFRATSLCLLLLMLAEPILTLTITRQVRPLLWLLVDGTDSMAIRDRSDRLDEDQREKLAKAVGTDAEVTGSTDPNAPPPSRIDYVKSLFRRQDDNLLDKLQEKVRLQAFVFDTAQGVRSLKLSPSGDGLVDGPYLAEQLTADGEVSALGTALDALQRRHSAGNLAGLVIFSDFNQNTGKRPLAAAKRLGAKICTVGIGATRADDLSVNLDAPLMMKKDERSTVTVVLLQHGFDKESVKVTVTARRLDSTGEAQDEVIPVGEKTVLLAGPSDSHEFPFVPKETGRLVFEVAVDQLTGEAGYENNRHQREVTVRDEFLRVLFVENEPNWEWRFIKEVFHRDRLVGQEGFRTYLRLSHPRVKQAQEMFLSDLRPSRKDFFQYDVIFLGDLPASALNPQFRQWTEEFVRDFGGGLVILSGQQFGPDQLVGTELEKMLPVKFHSGAGTSPGARIEDAAEFELQLTPWADRIDFMRLGPAGDDLAEAWKNLGPLPWYARVDGLHSDTRVLAEHPRDLCGTIGADAPGVAGPSGAGGDLPSDSAREAAPEGSRGAAHQPLIAIRKYGKGEVIYLGFNETWRLRRKFGERYYRQFWGQMIHRLGLSHALGSQKRFVPRTDRLSYRAEDDVILTVDAYDENYKALTDAELTRILEAAGADPAPKLHGELILPRRDTGGDDTQHLTLTRVRDGVFQTRFPVFTDGDYFVRVTDPVTGDPVEATFKVKTSDPIERRNPNRDLAVQQAIAAVNHGGRSYELADVHQLVDRIDATPKIEISKRVFPLWLTWLFFGGVVGLLLSEWLLRKWVNLQ